MKLTRTPDFLVMYPDMALCPRISVDDLQVDCALYIHIPFCEKFCHYCTFHKSRYEPELVDRFVRALETELTLAAEQFVTRRRKIRAIYFGGGTPSLLEPACFDGILNKIADCYDVAEDCEVSLECLPAPEMTIDRLMELRSAGINRVSVGVQTCSDQLLKTLGRKHTVEDSMSTMARVREAGFDNLHVDLMYAIPGQSMQVWEHTLRQIVALKPDHISAYPIIIFHGSKLWRMVERQQVQARPGEEIELAMNEVAIDMLTGDGYRQYSGTEFAYPGMACRYIMYSWGGRDFFGFGPSAYSYLDPLVVANTSFVTDYCRRLERGEKPIERGKILTSLERMRRDVALGLLLMEVDTRRFEERHGVAVDDVFGPTIAELETVGAVEYDRQAGVLRLTRLGVLYLPQVMTMFTEYEADAYLRIPV